MKLPAGPSPTLKDGETRVRLADLDAAPPAWPTASSS